MQRLLEIILGLEKGFLSQEGEFGLQFNPQWPGQAVVGAGVWNVLLVGLAVALVVYVYRREGHSRGARVALGILRLALLGFVIAMLNRPVVTLSQSRTEPSVVAVLVDDSISMRVRDAGADQGSLSRLEAAVRLLKEEDQKLLKELARQHVVRLYRFDRTAGPIGTIAALPKDKDPTALEQAVAGVVPVLEKLQPAGPNTQVVGAVRAVLEELQGQRLAGVVLLTDGRSTPQEPLAETLATLRTFPVKIFPIPIGSDKAPTNVSIDSIVVQDTAFKGDIVNLKATVRTTGFTPGHRLAVTLRDKKTGLALKRSNGQPVEEQITISGDGTQEVELQFKADQVGPLDVVVEAARQTGELDDEDNTRTTQLAVLDAQIAVLYVDGYPRWEYRYLMREMIREKSVDISCLLLSADEGFVQEGDRPITKFPDSMQEMLAYDVVIWGDVDPRRFTDSQLQLVQDFVSKKGGGFGMIAGPRWSPQAFRNTPIESVLPVNITQVTGGEEGTITVGFRPALTTVGAASSIFRFFEDRARTERFLREELQPIFWFCRGATVKPGVGEAYAEHPTELGPDGRRAPLLVFGRFGAGRTMFSAIDDSWRWRFYTGEAIFDTYWVQQLRHLARGRKLGQRRFTFVSARPVYELGEQIRLNMRVLDPELLEQLPEQIGVEVLDDSEQVVRRENLLRQEGQKDLYAAIWAADAPGKFTARLAPIAGGSEAQNLPIEVIVPRLELTNPQVDRTLLTRLASESLGQVVEYAAARGSLPAMIPSAAKIIPVESSELLWNAPLALILFVSLITIEWILRKAFGML